MKIIDNMSLSEFIKTMPENDFARENAEKFLPSQIDMLEAHFETISWERELDYDYLYDRFAYGYDDLAEWFGFKSFDDMVKWNDTIRKVMKVVNIKEKATDCINKMHETESGSLDLVDEKFDWLLGGIIADVYGDDDDDRPFSEDILYAVLDEIEFEENGEIVH